MYYNTGAWPLLVGNAPVVSITSPGSPPTITLGASQVFTATASDTEDGNLTSSIVWTSSIDGALGTGGTINPTLSAGSHTITASVTDSDSNSSSATIVATVVVSPANTVLPSISGSVTVGVVLTANNGTWTGFPAPTFTYQWRKCDSGGASCSNIAAATGTTYTPVSGDVGSTLRVVVTATNSQGTATATSFQTAVVSSGGGGGGGGAVVISGSPIF